MNGLQPASPYDDEDTDDDDDEFAEHLGLRHTMSREDVQVKVDIPRGETIAVTLEMLCVMGTIATFVPHMLLQEGGLGLWLPIFSTLPWVSAGFLEAWDGDGD